MGPFIEQQPYYDAFDFNYSCTDPINKQARKNKLAVFACPSDGCSENQWDHDFWARVRYNYVVNWGNTSSAQQETRGTEEFAGAPFTWGKPRRFSNIIDGTSSTLMLSEVLNPKGPDWEGSLGDITICRGGQAFETWTGPNSDMPDIVERSCPSTGNFNCELGYPGVPVDVPFPPNLHHAARSKHPGGVNAAMCDGSVHFFSDNIDLFTWRALSTTQGHEIIKDAF